MRVSDFDFDLPLRLVAQRPASPRDKARLLAVGRELRDLGVGDLPKLLDPRDVLVVNDTRVIPARLAGRRTRAGKQGPRIEATLIAGQGGQGSDQGGGPGNDQGGETWRALARPARKLQPGDRLDVAPGFTADVLAKGEGGEVTLGFDLAGDALAAALERHGIMPLPPYIKRAPGGDPSDRLDYQTLFAEKAGAVAAPTAGLHFTPELIRKIEARGVAVRRLTLHVGAGTFLPVKAADTRDHKMHAEWGEISADTAAAVNAARDRGGRAVAVGSTALRLMEAAAGEDGRLRAFRGETDIFITPGYRFRIVDALLTNFHLPRSTLFMLAAAFAGLEKMKAAYAHAKAQGYRFYSYGDACWLERHDRVEEGG